MYHMRLFQNFSFGTASYIKSIVTPLGKRRVARQNLEVLRQEGLRIAVVNFESLSAYLSDYVLEVEKHVVADVIAEGGVGRPLGNHSGDPPAVPGCTGCGS